MQLSNLEKDKLYLKSHNCRKVYFLKQYITNIRGKKNKT